MLTRINYDGRFLFKMSFEWKIEKGDVYVRGVKLLSVPDEMKETRQCLLGEFMGVPYAIMFVDGQTFPAGGDFFESLKDLLTEPVEIIILQSLLSLDMED